MDFFNHSRPLRFLQSFSKRIQRLSPTHAKSHRITQNFWKLPSWIVGIFFFILAFSFGKWAYEVTHSQAIENWEKTHRPSLSFLQVVLKAYGFHEMNDEKKIQKILNILPAHEVQAGTIWVDEKLHWFIFFEESYFIYTLLESLLPSHWQSLGKGWRALEKWLDLLKSQNIQFSPVDLPSTAKKEIFQDPREIVY